MRRKQLRGDFLVRHVIEVTLAELSAKGYEGLSIEDVALRADVNKTTIYRRWPTKKALARAALEHVAGDFDAIEDTGSIRTDLVTFLGRLRDFATSARGQTLMRMLLAEDPAIVSLAQSLRAARECIPYDVVARAVARKELPRGTDGALLFNVLVGTLQHEVLFARGKANNIFITKLVDMVLRGAENLSATRPAPARASARAPGRAPQKSRARR